MDKRSEWSFIFFAVVFIIAIHVWMFSALFGVDKWAHIAFVVMTCSAVVVARYSFHLIKGSGRPK